MIDALFTIKANNLAFVYVSAGKFVCRFLVRLFLLASLRPYVSALFVMRC
jgi:hypothetical protein